MLYEIAASRYIFPLCNERLQVKNETFDTEQPSDLR